MVSVSRLEEYLNNDEIDPSSIRQRCNTESTALEISNATPLFNKIYADEGICQLLFYQGDPCDVSYQERKGKYQNQPMEVTLAKA